MLTFLCLVMMVICYLSGVWVYCSKRKHLLIILLSLEYMVLFTFFINLLISHIGFWVIFVCDLFGFAVCEGSLGLGMLVSMVRFHGNDLFQSFVVLRW